MSYEFATYRRATKVIVSLAFVGATGVGLSCSKTRVKAEGDEVGPVSMASADTTGRFVLDTIEHLVSGAARAESQPAAGTPPGELPGGHDIEYFEQHASDFYDFVGQRGFPGPNRKRKCSGKDPVCKANPNRTTAMTIGAMSGSEKVYFDQAPPKDLVVGRLINTGGVLDSIYPDCPADVVYRAECYVVISKENGMPKQKLAILRTITLNDYTLKVVDLTPGLHDCGHPKAASDRRADFRGCKDWPTAGPADSAKFVPGFVAGALHAWMPCAEGCCST